MNKFVSVGLACSLVFGAVGMLPKQTIQKVEASGFTYTQEQQDALKYVNDLRQNMGLKPVELNPFLNKAAENHASYINLNNTMWGNAHEELKGSKGFTGVDGGERINAVGGDYDIYSNWAEDISFSKSSIIAGITSLMNTEGHRIPIVDSNLRYIGFGKADGTIVLEMNDNPDMTNMDEAVYPYNGQTNVPINFYGSTEKPNPLEQFHVDKSGYIISYSSNSEITSMDIKLANSKGVVIPCFKDIVWSDGFFFPKTELLYNEKYTATVTYKNADSGDNVLTKTWSFTTMNGTNPTPTPPKPPVKVDPCKGFSGKIVWGGMELKKGQIGKLTVLKKTALYAINSNKTLKVIKWLKPKDVYRIYSLKNDKAYGNLVGLGGNNYIKRDNNVKYETPSKAKLDLTKCLK